MFPPWTPFFTFVVRRMSSWAALGQSPATPAECLLPPAEMSEFRVGIGIDAHAFGDGVPLVLGGIPIDHARGLVGHSDGDVIAHALTDAVLGAAALGDIGSLFPSDDERYRGADSLQLLAQAYTQVRAAGFELVNADCVLIGEGPRIAGVRDEMRARLAGALGVAAEQIAVRATTTDRLGFTGRGEGLVAQAVALLRQPD
jgi:2-C-methyl-D-erythritol 2,4-cyclodiphosphate synthase